MCTCGPAISGYGKPVPLFDDRLSVFVVHPCSAAPSRLFSLSSPLCTSSSAHPLVPSLRLTCSLGQRGPCNTRVRPRTVNGCAGLAPASFATVLALGDQVVRSKEVSRRLQRIGRRRRGQRCSTNLKGTVSGTSALALILKYDKACAPSWTVLAADRVSGERGDPHFRFPVRLHTQYRFGRC